MYKTNIESVKNVYGELIGEIDNRLSALQARFNQALKTPEEASRYKNDLYTEVLNKGSALALIDGEPVQIGINDVLLKSLDDIAEYIINNELPPQIADIQDTIVSSLDNISNGLKERYFVALT